jgi:hypothetical protein
MSYCPFCGVFAETPHKTQEACIDALNVEIVRMRELLDQVRSRVNPAQSPVLTQILEEDPTSDAQGDPASTRRQTTY